MAPLNIPPLACLSAGWSVLLNHALKTSVALQGRIEQGAANRARQETAAEVEELKAQLKDAQAKWKTEHDRRKALHNEVSGGPARCCC